MADSSRYVQSRMTWSDSVLRLSWISVLEYVQAFSIFHTISWAEFFTMHVMSPWQVFFLYNLGLRFTVYRKFGIFVGNVPPWFSVLLLPTVCRSVTCCCSVAGFGSIDFTPCAGALSFDIYFVVVFWSDVFTSGFLWIRTALRSIDLTRGAGVVIFDLRLVVMIWTWRNCLRLLANSDSAAFLPQKICQVTKRRSLICALLHSFSHAGTRDGVFFVVNCFGGRWYL